MRRLTIRLTVSAMLLALGLLLPFLTGQLQQLGSMLLPMHIPVFLCGMICGPIWGGAVGAALPLLRSALFGMPMLYPMAAAMSPELAVYGAVSGVLYLLFRNRGVLGIYLSMLPAMLLGRAAWGLVRFLMLGLRGTLFSRKMFLAGALTGAIPGIALQLILIPAVLYFLRRAGILARLEAR